MNVASLQPPAPREAGHVAAPAWSIVPLEEVSPWNERLSRTRAHYRQYPYWAEGYLAKRHFNPVFLCYGDLSRPAGYAVLLVVRHGPVRLGLLERGPVVLENDVDPHRMARGLANWARGRGLAFLRLTHRDRDLVDAFGSVAKTILRESYPFHRDPLGSLFVTLKDDDELLKSFQAVGRREIKMAEAAGYNVEVLTDPEAFDREWPMLERLALRKSAELSERGREAWRATLQRADGFGLSYVFRAIRDGRSPCFVHVLRYGRTAEFMLGALDVPALGGSPSPAALTHWSVMRFMRDLGCSEYNMGGKGDGVRNRVYEFKRKFRPELRPALGPLTVVLNEAPYRLWRVAVVWGLCGGLRLIRRVRTRARLLAGLDQPSAIGR
jgi:hypothetical protein